MFTGIIDEIGTIERVADTAAGRELRVRCTYTDIAAGESIALNGACLTVREHGPGWFTVAAVVTTLERTNVADWGMGTRVNLERAVRAGDRLGGHLVQGHVDDVGVVYSRWTRDDALIVDVRLPREFCDLTVLHGSIAIDGVSLTVDNLPTPESVRVSLIPYTVHHTTLGLLELGQRVHVEVDVIAKYVQRLLVPIIPAVH